MWELPPSFSARFVGSQFKECGFGSSFSGLGGWPVFLGVLFGGSPLLLGAGWPSLHGGRAGNQFSGLGLALARLPHGGGALFPLAVRRRSAIPSKSLGLAIVGLGTWGWCLALPSRGGGWICLLGVWVLLLVWVGLSFSRWELALPCCCGEEVRHCFLEWGVGHSWTWPSE